MNKEKLQAVNETIIDGCSECGMAYSFYFGVQIHKVGCSKGDEE